MSAQTSDLLDIARRVAASAGPGEEVEAYVMRTHETEVEVFGGDVESLTTAGIEGIGVRVIVDHRQGYASAGSLDVDVIDETLREARDNASFSEPDDWNGLATPDDIGGVEPADLDLWRDELLSMPTEQKVRIALDLEAATKARDSRVRGVEAAGYGDARSESAIANSWGVESSTRRTTCSAHAIALADDGSGTQTGYGFSAGRSLAELDLETIPVDAVDRAVRLLGAEPIAGRRTPVILDPLVTRSVLGVLSSAFNGEMVLKGRSLFAGRDGEVIASPLVEIVDDPTDARAFGAAVYDSEGLPTRRNELVVDGALRGFLQNTYT
ncbi:MAG: TldD/PmbA family protein, partial [Acidimicrobiia bacterium]